MSAGVILAVMISVFFFCIELLSPSSAQATYPSPCRLRQGSFISLRLLFPSNPLRWASMRTPLGAGVPGQRPGECGRRIAGRDACPTQKGGLPPQRGVLRCPHPALPQHCGGAVRIAGSCEEKFIPHKKRTAALPSKLGEKVTGWIGVGLRPCADLISGAFPHSLTSGPHGGQHRVLGAGRCSISTQLSGGLQGAQKRGTRGGPFWTGLWGGWKPS